MGGVRQPGGIPVVGYREINAQQPRIQPVPEGLQSALFFPKGPGGLLDGLCQPDNQRSIDRPPALALLLSTALYEARQHIVPGIALCIDKADPLRTIHLVPGKTGKIDKVQHGSGIHLSKCLGGIRKKE